MTIRIFENTLSQCCKETIYVDTDVVNGGLWCTKCEKEVYSTIDKLAYEKQEYEKQSFVFDQVSINPDKETFNIPAYTVVELKPKHYAKGIDTFSRMEANCTIEERLSFAKGNIDKYTWREKGQDKEDFEKIIVYANWALKQINDEVSR